VNRLCAVAAVGAAFFTLTACGSESEPSSVAPATNAPLPTENTNSAFCTTFAAFDSTSVFLHGREDTIRPGLELQIEQVEQLRSTLPPELASSQQGLDTRLAAIQATLDIYAANDFDVDAVSADPTYNDVSETIGASLQADVLNATSATREYCGIEL
jgi:hypothetical protein